MPLVACTERRASQRTDWPGSLSRSDMQSRLHILCRCGARKLLSAMCHLLRSGYTCGRLCRQWRCRPGLGKSRHQGRSGSSPSIRHRKLECMHWTRACPTGKQYRTRRCGRSSAMAGCSQRNPGRRQSRWRIPELWWPWVAPAGTRLPCTWESPRTRGPRCWSELLLGTPGHRHRWRWLGRRGQRSLKAAGSCTAEGAKWLWRCHLQASIDDPTDHHPTVSRWDTPPRNRPNAGRASPCTGCRWA